MAALPDPDTPPPARVEPVLLPRWVQLVLLPLAILGFVAILRAAGPIVLLFIVAALIALLLNPFVSLLRRIRFPRGLAVLTVMACVVLVVTTIGFLLSNPIADQVSAFQRNVPDIVDDANASLADFQDWLDRNGIDVRVKEEGSTALQTLGRNLSEGSGELVSFTSDALQILVEASIALILVIVLSVYMLLYGERIGQVVRSLVPRGDGTPEDDFPSRIQAAVFGYVRGQLLFSLIMGTSAGVVLWVLGSVGVFPEGKTYAVAFGATMWPSICCSAVNAITSHSASSGSPLKSAIITGGNAPIAGPMYGISSANPYQAPNATAYVLPSGKTPSEPSTHSSTPALVPMISENSSWPRT